MESVLLVEDSNSFASFFKNRAKESCNIEVVVAGSLAEATEIVENSGVKLFLVVLGLYLPDANDGQAIDYFLARKIPSMVLTGTFKKELQNALIKRGVLDYFVKDNIGVVDSVIHAIDRFRKNQNTNILVVDDSRSVRAMLSTLLRRYGFNILEAVDGREALGVIAKQSVQVVVSDYQMPNMDGIQMIKKLRTRFLRDEIAVIGLSSVENTELPVQFIKSGANDFLVKPYQPEELLCRVYQNVEIIERHKELESLLARHQSVLDHSLDAIVSVDARGRVTDYNPAAENLFGFSKKTLLGKLISDYIIPEEFRVRHQEAMSRRSLSELEKNPLQKRLEFPGQRADGKVIDLQLSLTSMVQDDQPSFTAFIQDITDKKQLLISLEETLAAAESANKAKSEFIANMSHEIRTPMNAVLGFTELAQRAVVSPKVHDYLDKIENASRSLMGIINDILDFSKIEVGHLELDPVKFDLQQLLDHLSDLFSKQVADKNIELTLLAPVSFDEVLYGDVMRIEQILINLIRNAVKFTPEGTITVNCTPEILDEDKIRLVFSVKDSGIGINPEILGNLFTPFVQADGSTTRKYGGTGLGLSICKRLVHLMGGEIWANSIPDEGSEFAFEIFVEHHSENRRQFQSIPESLWGRKTLLVDDNPMARKQIGDLLKSLSLNPIVVSSGAEAVKELEKTNGGPEPYEFVFLDMNMPQKDGVVTATEILATLNGLSSTAKIPSLFLMTAFGIESHKVEGEKAGIHLFIDKPITRKRLIRTIVEEFEQVSEQADRRSEKILGHEGTTGNKIGGSRVLLAEDNDINRQIARELLERVGIIVECAVNGQEVLDKVDRFPFDAVLMDIQMPVMDGLQAARRIRADDRFKTLPIIAMTAHSLPEEIKRCLDAGMNGHLDKPIRTERLYGILSKWIEAFELSTEQISIDFNSKSLPVIEGIDVSEGLERVSGNVKLFQKLLLRFKQEYGGTAEFIRQALMVEDYDTVVKQLHTIKGVAGNIGALSLYRATEQFETLAVAGDQEACKAAMATFANKLNAIIDSLGGLDGIGPVPVQHPDNWHETLKLDLDPAQVSPLLYNLFYHLGNNSIDVVDTLEHLKKILEPTPALPVFAELKKQVENYNFKEALDGLARISSALEIDLSKTDIQPPPVRGQRVLVVDDQRSNIDLLRDILGDFHLTVALNGHQALKVACSEMTPDIILLDIMMPEINGYEVCRQLKANERTRGIPVIFVTAKKEVSDEEEGFEAGGVDYISKPFNSVIIRRRVITHLELKQHRDSLEALVDTRTRELAAAKQEAEDRREAAESGSRAKSRFLATMSHEIRTPMNAILGMGEVLKESGLSPEQDSTLKTLTHAGESLLSLINDILDLSKIEAGQLQIERLSFDLPVLVRETYNILQKSAQSKEISYECQVHEGCPRLVMGDPQRLRQVLLNLLVNAIKFTEKGRISLEVESGAGDTIDFTVSDTGIGIPAEELQNIFDPFQQVDDSTSRRFGGTGLGLSICSQLAQAMGGTVQVESLLGQGSVFRFSANLPRSKEKVSDEELVRATRATEREEAETSTVSSANILLVDDAKDNRMVISAYLRHTPHRITEVINGEEAVAAFKTGNYDLVLMDMLMPVLDGIGATKQIRAWEEEHNRPRTPIVALTANAMRQDEEKTLEAGCDLHLSKPLRKARLIDVISKFCVG